MLVKWPHLPLQANVSENSKKETLCTQEKHLLLATTERSFYRDMCSDSKAIAKERNIVTLKKCPPNSRDFNFHYSFDFAQQIHYPADPQQLGPIYFKTPRKCQVFGVHAEGILSQMNYLLDEAVSCGKGANVVISLLHHFLEFYGVGEKHLKLSADNCACQNKNNIMIQYLCWRTLTGLHSSVSVHFMLAGHTKFAPDWCFGLFKRLFKRTFVSSLEDVSAVVEKSTEKAINRVQLVGDQDGNVIVKMFDWQQHLQQFFRKMPTIKTQQHFRVGTDEPGLIFYKKSSEEPELSFNILKQAVIPGLPQIIKPKGMDLARRQYLYKEIRAFCRSGTETQVCPQPEYLIIDDDSDSNNIEPVKGNRGRGRGRGRTGRGRGK